MCLHTWQTLQLWPLRKILLNVSMEASTFSLSGMLAYSKDYNPGSRRIQDTFEAAQAIHVERCLQLWPFMQGGQCLTFPWELLAALAMHGVHVALSTEGSAELYVLRRNITNMHAWQKLFNLSIGGVACLPCNGSRHMQPPLQRLLREGYFQSCSKDS